jgi:hypothetical protein
MQDKNRCFGKYAKFLLGHLFANGYTFYELTEALSNNDTAKVKSLLIKLCIYTFGQLVLKHFKSGKDDENNRQ